MKIFEIIPLKHTIKIQIIDSGNVPLSTKMTEGSLKNPCLCNPACVRLYKCLFAFSFSVRAWLCECMCYIVCVYLISAAKPLTCTLSLSPCLPLILFNNAVCTGSFSFIFPSQYRDMTTSIFFS